MPKIYKEYNIVKVLDTRVWCGILTCMKHYGLCTNIGEWMNEILKFSLFCYLC